MKPSTKALVAVTTSVVSSSALAHAGHDHAADTAMLTHIIFYGSIATGLAFSAFFAVKYFSKSK